MSKRKEVTTGMKFQVYAIQGVQMSTLEIEAASKDEAIAAYTHKWNEGDVDIEDYRDDKIEYVVEVVAES